MATSIRYLNGNNTDQTSSMFWEGSFHSGRSFELKLRFGSMLLHLDRKEIFVANVDDFPRVRDVERVFREWLDSEPDGLDA